VFPVFSKSGFVWYNQFLVTSIEKVYRILELLRRHYKTGLTNKELSNRLKIPSSTCYRIMKSLKNFDFVSQRKIDKRFFLGFSHLRFADALVGGMDVPAVCLPHLERLHDSTKDTTLLTVFSGQHSIVVDICGNINVLMSIARGEVMPMHCAASGKAILAFLPEPEKSGLLESLDYHVFTEKTITDPAELRKQLGKIHETGVAFNFREFHPDTVAISSPIFSRQGSVIGSIGIVGRAENFDVGTIDTYSKLMLVTSREITEELGGIYPPWLGHKAKTK
jgi:DNA-binding IclR family transcriptional regulator